MVAWLQPSEGGHVPALVDQRTPARVLGQPAPGRSLGLSGLGRTRVRFRPYGRPVSSGSGVRIGPDYTRFGHKPAWSWASRMTAGGLLANTTWPYPAPP